MPPRGGGAKNRPGRPPQTREVTISKNLGYLLRHGAVEEGIKVDEGGWANVEDVLLWRRLASLKVTLAELTTIVTSNDKQRFQIIPQPASSPTATTTNPPSSPTPNPSAYLIRAVQGHSLPTVSAEKLLTPVSLSDPDCPNLVVHGTYPNSWREILKSGGLKPMSRNHIHFAIKEPDSAPIQSGVDRGAKGTKVKELPEKGEGQGAEKVISGMRKGASVLIWVDLKRCLRGGVEWWRSENGVFLTEGVERGAGGVGEGEKKERVLGVEWIRWVERRGTGEVLWKGEGDDVEGERARGRNKGVDREGKGEGGDGGDGGKGVDGVKGVEK
ncbi:hypothetical protein ACLMJK_008846 [Lecanora helva]